MQSLLIGLGTELAYKGLDFAYNKYVSNSAAKEVAGGEEEKKPRKVRKDKGIKRPRKENIQLANKRGLMSMDSGIFSPNARDVPSPPDAPMEEMAIAGTSSAAGVGGGAGEIGSSTGNWLCDTQWGDSRVTTNCTRTWCLPTFNEQYQQGYVQISNSTDTSGNEYFGYATPWANVNFNRYNLFFSPADWQKLVNEYKGWRPKAMHVKIFNIQIKEVNAGPPETIQNNLTSTVQVLVDEDYALPYTVGCNTLGNLSRRPWATTCLPQYAYCVSHWTGDGSQFVPPFYIMEDFPSTMLRTGDCAGFSYHFDNCKWYNNCRSAQDTYRLCNPLLDQLVQWPQATNTDAAAALWNAKNKNYWKGPILPLQENIQKAFLVSDASTGTATAAWTQIAPGVSVAHQLDGTLSNQKNTQVMGTNPGQTMFEQHGAQDNTGAYTATLTDNMIGLYPGQTWNNITLEYDSQIWAKIPDTDEQCFSSPLMGGFGLKKPPPQIFIKNTPVPGVPKQGVNGLIWPVPPEQTPQTNPGFTSWINQYSVGQITVSIEWELQKYNYRQWNPHSQLDNTIQESFTVGANGAYQHGNMQSRFKCKPL